MTVDRNPNNDELLVGGADGTPKIYQMHRTKARQIGDDFNLIRAFEPMPGRIFSVRYSADGTRIVAGSSSDGQGEVRVYQEADAKLVSRFAYEHGDSLHRRFSSRTAKKSPSAGSTAWCCIYDPDSGSLLREFMPVPLTAGRRAAGRPITCNDLNIGSSTRTPQKLDRI